MCTRMPPSRFASGWWKLIGERVCDESCNAEEVFYPLSDEDTQFSDLNPVDIVHTTKDMVNDGLQIIIDNVTYERAVSESLGSSPESESEADLRIKQAKNWFYPKHFSHMKKWFYLLKENDDRFGALVSQFAEEITAGRVRHLIKLGYLPEGYSEIYEGFPSIIPDDRDFFSLTDEDFRNNHERKNNGSLTQQEPGGSAPKPEQEPGSSAPEPEREPGSSAPEPEQEPGSSAPAPEQEPGSSAPEPEQEPGSSAPEPEQEPGSSAPEPEQEPGSSAPEPEQEPGGSAPKPEQEPGSSAPELEQEPGSSAPEPKPEPGSSAPEPEQEPGSSAPEPKSSRPRSTD